MNRKDHWNAIYHSKASESVSWFESVPQTSLRLLEAAGMSVDSCVLDIGGGDSRLIDHLAARGMRCLAVLDVAGAALQRARVRLGPLASIPTWIEADVAEDWSARPVDIWHDRAVFHFLTLAGDRDRYRAHLRQTLKPGGSAVIATFALEAPERCSGLPVVRYSAESLSAELGPGFRMRESVPHVHTTPWGSAQPFVYCRFQLAA